MSCPVLSSASLPASVVQGLVGRVGALQIQSLGGGVGGCIYLYALKPSITPVSVKMDER